MREWAQQLIATGSYTRPPSSFKSSCRQSATPSASSSLAATTVDAPQLTVSENETSTENALATNETNTVVSSQSQGANQPSSTAGPATLPRVEPTAVLFATGMNLFVETPSISGTKAGNAALIPPTEVHAGVVAKPTAAVKSSSGLFLLKKRLSLVCFVVAIACNWRRSCEYTLDLPWLDAVGWFAACPFLLSNSQYVSSNEPQQFVPCFCYFLTSWNCEHIFKRANGDFCWFVTKTNNCVFEIFSRKIPADCLSNVEKCC